MPEHPFARASVGDGVVDLTETLGPGLGTLRDVLEPHALVRLREAVDGRKPDFALADVHAGNLGLAAGAEHWSIFDLGHPETTSVTHEPGTTLFEVLEP